MKKLPTLLNTAARAVRMFALVIVIWSALVAGSLAWYMHLHQQSVLNTATAAARANINKDINFRKWAATHGGVYVPPTEHTPPNPYLKVPDRDVVTTTGKTLTLMNPAYMLRQLQSDFPGDYGTRSHLTSLKPLNPNNAPDAWEAKALHAFEQGGKELLEQQQIDGQPYLRMMLPLIVEPGCLKCHAQQGYKLGDIRGGVGTAVPLTPFLAREQGIRDSLVLSHGAIWLIGLAGLVWLGILFRRIERMEIFTRSAAAIEKSERRFRAVTESANDAIINADSAGKVVDWNLSAERLFGYTKAEIIGQPLAVLMPERFRDLHSAGLARVAGGGAPHVIGKTVELAGLRKDGSEFPLEFSLAQWQTAEGQFFTAIIRDITERKQVVAALRESEAEFHTLAEAMPQIVWITRSDGWNIYFNQQWMDYTGLTLEESMGHGWNKPFHPDDQQQAWDAWQQATATGGIYSIESRLRRADGVYHWWLVRGIPQKDANGNILKWFGTCTDIHDMKMAELEISRANLEVRESERRFTDMLENVEMVSMMLDREARITYCNKYLLRLTGWRHEEIIEKNWFDIFTPPELTDLKGSFFAALLADLPEAWHHENELLTRSGERRLIRWNNSVLRSAEGDVIGTASIGEDITERKQVEAQLAEQLDELRRWNDATMGREIRIIELKHEVNELLGSTGQPLRYPSAESDDQSEK